MPAAPGSESLKSQLPPAPKTNTVGAWVGAAVAGGAGEAAHAGAAAGGEHSAQT